MSGTVISTYTTTGVVVSLASQEPILVTSTGTIAASESAVSSNHYGVSVMQVAGMVTNEGLISGLDGVEFSASGTILNKGLIIAASYGVDITSALGTPSTVANYGTIRGTGAPGYSGRGVKLYGSGAIINGSSLLESGVISGAQAGIYMIAPSIVNYYGTQSVVNFGTVIGSGKSSEGIEVISESQYDSASISNGSENVRTALIEGTTGIDVVLEATDIENYGTIIGTGDAGIDGGDMLVNGSTSDTVSLIKGVLYGVDGGSSITNFGTIISTGATSEGLVTGGSFILNGAASSVIEGESIGIAEFSSSPLIINNGTIAASGAGGIGLRLLSGAATVVNAGTIFGTTDAILAESGSLYLTVLPAAVFEGAVLDNSGTGKLVLGGTSAGSLNMNGNFQGVDDETSGFDSITFETGATWTLEGQASDFNNYLVTQTISGFDAGDTIIFDGFAATFAEFVNDIGVVLDGGNFDEETIGIRGDFTTGDFDITTNGTSTTIALFDQIGAGNLTVIAGSVLSDPYIASGADVSVQSGGTVSHALIAGGTLELGTGSDVIGDITFSGAGRLIIDGAAPVSNVITGFTAGDTIELAGIPFVGTGGTFGTAGEDTYTIANAGTLTIDADGDIFHLNIPGLTAGQHNLHLSGDLGITETAPCFTAGTRILTAHGEIPVEALGVGDLVVTHEGGLAPVVWIGKRTVDVGRHHRPELVSPVLIQAGALADGVPCRDLAVSPDHAFYLDGHLVPAKTLVNGWTIRWLNVPRVTYYHVELPAHGVLFAEGAAAESYLETGNRCAFENGFGAMRLHPDFAQTMREAEGCAPFAESGAVVEAIRRRILMRARIPVTNNPELRVTYRRDDAVIESRSAIPGEIFADPRDRRRLGVKIAAISTSHGMIALDHPALCDGWHDPEPDGRWTDGHAVVPKSLLRGAQIGEVVLASTLAYPARGWLERLPGRC